MYTETTPALQPAGTQPAIETPNWTLHLPKQKQVKYDENVLFRRSSSRYLRFVCRTIKPGLPQNTLYTLFTLTTDQRSENHSNRNQRRTSLLRIARTNPQASLSLLRRILGILLKRKLKVIELQSKAPTTGQKHLSKEAPHREHQQMLSITLSNTISAISKALPRPYPTILPFTHPHLHNPIHLHPLSPFFITPSQSSSRPP